MSSSDLRTSRSQRTLSRLTSLWYKEQRATREAFARERQEQSLEERAENGLAMRNLELVDTDAAPGDRTLLWLSPGFPDELDTLRLSTGSPLKLWRHDPEEPEAVEATLARKTRHKIAIMVDGDVPEIFEGRVHLDRDAPQATFERGLRALEAFRNADRDSAEARLREVLLGDERAQFHREEPPQWLDGDLNPPQRKAVLHAFQAQDLALIHGPPGTGKTRTLVEVVRQALARGERVLATAASNTAVDNLAEKLVAAGVDLVRLGHPARVSEAVEAKTLDTLLEKTDAFKLARRWNAEASEMRRKASNKLARGTISRREEREAWRAAKQLARDARKQLKAAQERILGRARVVCATSAGSDSFLMGEQRFDLVVLDEATQATTPIVLVALRRGDRVVMAGDPMQLPPTVISREAEKEGLGTSLFEELSTDDAELSRMLVVQHRMHEDLMGYPSLASYDGKLVAADHVAQQRLQDLGVPEDPLRPGPLVFLDTAGRGWEEERTEKDPSTSNPGHAERTCAELRRLLGRGVPPKDVAIITPYHAQVRLLRGLLREEVAQGVDIGSVDGFQGREKEVVLLDLVRSNDQNQLGFLKDTRRMNVALTRARRLLVVIGDSATIGIHPYYAAFMEHVETLPDAWVSTWNDEAPLWEEHYTK